MGLGLELRKVVLSIELLGVAVRIGVLDVFYRMDGDATALSARSVLTIGNKIGHLGKCVGEKNNILEELTFLSISN